MIPPYARDLTQRRACASPDRPMADRPISVHTLAQRVREVALAHKAQDIPATRFELRALAREATQLADQDVIS